MGKSLLSEINFHISQFQVLDFSKLDVFEVVEEYHKIEKSISKKVEGALVRGTKGGNAHIVQDIVFNNDNADVHTYDLTNDTPGYYSLGILENLVRISESTLSQKEKKNYEEYQKRQSNSQRQPKCKEDPISGSVFLRNQAQMPVRG